MQVVWHRRFRPPVVYRTSGTGEWCLKQAEMLVNHLVLVRASSATYYLLVYFDEKKWDIEQDGYVVNDPGWNQCLRCHLRDLKFSEESIDSLDFGEMSIVHQSHRRAVVPVGEQFVTQCDRLVRFLQGESDNEQLT